jgi:hypothetical protein
MLKKTLCAVLALTAALSLFGQAGQTPARIGSAADLDRETAELALKIRQFPGLPGKKLEVSAVSLSGQEPALGAYWKNALIGQLAGGAFTVLEPGPLRGDYQVIGEILDLGQTVRIFTRLSDRSTSAVLASWTSDLEKSPFLENLLAVSSGGASPVVRDSHEEDSRDTPLEAAINGQAIPRTIHQNDTDWFVIRPSESVIVVMETRGPVDTIMELYEGSTRLSRDDDSGGEENARISCQLEGGETYIAMVKGYSSSDTGRYEFLVRSVEPADKGREPNNTRETALAVTAGQDIEGYIASGADRDWYRFTMNSAGSVSIFTQGRTDTFLELYNAGGRKLAGDDDGGDGDNGRIIQDLEAGEYFILVRGYERSTTGEYLLRFQIRQSPAGNSDEGGHSR